MLAVYHRAAGVTKAIAAAPAALESTDPVPLKSLSRERSI
jgi:hypothetical protein